MDITIFYTRSRILSKKGYNVNSFNIWFFRMYNFYLFINSFFYQSTEFF